MPLLVDDDENAALAAALSFIDTFSTDTSAQDQDTLSPGTNKSVGEEDLDQLLRDDSDRQSTANGEPSAQLELSLQRPGDQVDWAVTNKHGKGRKRRQANPNKARNERKQEIAYLRVKAQQLETKLETLRHRPRRSFRGLCRTAGALTSSDANRVLETSSPGHSSRKPPVWRGIAERQQKRRERSERENARLKLVLQSQVKTAKSMQDLLQRRLRTHVAGCAEATGSLGDLCSQRSFDELLGDTTIYNSLLECIDKTYAAMDEVFTRNGLLGSKVPHHDAQMRQGASGIYLDVFSTKIFPFRFEDVAPAVWNHFKGNDKHHGIVSENASKSFGTSSETILEAFTMHIEGKGRQAAFFNRQIVKRYIEEDQQVVVWVSRGNEVRQEDSPYSSFGFVEKGYVVTKHTEHDGFSAVQMCTLLLPQATSSCIVDRALVDFVLDFVASTVAASQDLIESVLLEQSLRLAVGT